MNGILSYKKAKLVFKQWSSKKYAVFASLGKQVCIGHINIDICDKASEKSKSRKINLAEEKNETQTNDEEFDDTSITFSEQQLSQLLNLTTTSKASVGVLLENYITIKIISSLQYLERNNLFNKSRDYDYRII